MSNHPLVATSLSAVPPDDAYQTYVWLDNDARDGDDAAYHQLLRDFVQAQVLELSGKAF